MNKTDKSRNAVAFELLDELIIKTGLLEEELEVCPDEELNTGPILSLH